ncbi:ABC transporter ATP-binding protein [Rhizobium sp. YTUHZ044]|uniref:ABC transporter ATP-binding protein n=1 Tax=Rhizobium sp. YTUHZ044 TaxID=2962678 RepID=UPI003DA9F403
MASLTPPVAQNAPAGTAGARGSKVGTQPDWELPRPGKRRLLEVSELDVWIGNDRKTRLLESVSLDIEDGEFLALVGESGSGKSLLCSTLMDILPDKLHASGKIHFDGKSLAEAGRSSRAMIFQQPTRFLNPVRTIGFQLGETVRIASGLSKREADDRTLFLIDAVGIDDARAVSRKYPHQLSGGMNQRVMIALALARQPRLLIADEPTSALDVTTQRQIMDLIERLRSEWNMAILFVTHDLDLALERADRIGVIYAGQLVENAHAEEIARRPVHPYTRHLFSAVPEISTAPSKLVSLPGGVPDPAIRADGCHFAQRCSNVLDVCRSTTPIFASRAANTVACHNPGADHAAS